MVGEEVCFSRAWKVASPMPAVAPTSATVGPDPALWREVLLRWMSERETMVMDEIFGKALLCTSRRRD
jgi:hypothetical protein